MKLTKGYSVSIDYHRFSELDRFSAFLEHIFLLHQKAILKNDWEAALDYLTLFYEWFRELAREVSEILLPAYKQFIRPVPPGGDANFFIQEQTFVLKSVPKFVDLLGRKLLDMEGTPLNLVELFDEYTYVKDMLDHHHARKRYLLFKYLDQHLPPVERERILALIRDRHIQLAEKLEMDIESS